MENESNASAVYINGLRDMFAAKALEGALCGMQGPTKVNPNILALFCYNIADAMLKERAGRYR